MATGARHEFSDRFMPRRESENWQSSFMMTSEDVRGKSVYRNLVASEMLGSRLESKPRVPNSSGLDLLPTPMFRYNNKSVRNELTLPASASPFSTTSHELIEEMRTRKTDVQIPAAPYYLLSAPGLVDDYYSNMLDWSSKTIVAVVMAGKIYLFNNINQCVELCGIGTDVQSDDETKCVKWNPTGDYLAVGTKRGNLKVYDTYNGKLVADRRPHTEMICSLEWRNESLFTGSKDKSVKLVDFRTGIDNNESLVGCHEREVLGLSWCETGSLLASGGRDNCVNLWTPHMPNRHMSCLSGHVGAVKGLSWCNQQYHVLASGGGLDDCSIRIWNTLSGNCIKSVDTHSQVCNVKWAKNKAQLVSTHGFGSNDVKVWEYPSLACKATLTDHEDRVLYMSYGPNATDIVTGSSDESLAFWHVFPETIADREEMKCYKSQLNMFTNLR